MPDTAAFDEQRKVAGPGAGAYQMAGAMAENVNRLKLGVTVTNRATQGFVANTRMVETGGTQFALTNGIFVYSAQNGQKPFDEMKAKSIRGIGPVSRSWFQMAVVKSSSIKSYMDLKGSNTEFMTRTIFEQLGIADTIQKEYMRWDQAATSMTDGNIAAFGIPNPVPSSSILQASASTPVRILPLPDKVIKYFVDRIRLLPRYGCGGILRRYGERGLRDRGLHDLSDGQCRQGVRRACL